MKRGPPTDLSNIAKKIKLSNTYCDYGKSNNKNIATSLYNQYATFFECCTEENNTALNNDSENEEDDDLKSEYINHDHNQQRLFHQNGKLWKNGKTLNIYFMDGDDTIIAKVFETAQNWCKYANIKLKRTNNIKESDIRITFTKEGVWSKIGTDATLNQFKYQETMNFGIFNANTTDEIYSRKVLHEFGHALGFLHEHSHPIQEIPYDKQKLYTYYRKHCGWDKIKVDNNILNRVSPLNVTGFGYEIDKDSIMLYRVRKMLLKPDHDPKFDKMSKENHELSLIDKQKAYRIYPFEYPKIGITVKILSKKDVKESFQIAARDGYKANIYDNYCGRTGIVCAHHTTNGVKVRFIKGTEQKELWYEPISMKIEDNDNKSKSIAIFNFLWPSKPNNTIKINRLFVGDHIQINSNKQEGIIQFHDTDNFGMNQITISIKPYKDKIHRLSSNEVRKISVCEKTIQQMSSDLECRAMLIGSQKRRNAAERMKKAIEKYVYVVDDIILNEDDSLMGKNVLLIEMNDMFNDKKRESVIIYYYGCSDNKTGDWNFNGKWNQFTIELNDIITAWDQRKFLNFCKRLLIISDCNNSGKWVDNYHNHYDGRGDIIIQASCRTDDKTHQCPFSFNTALGCIVTETRNPGKFTGIKTMWCNTKNYINNYFITKCVSSYSSAVARCKIATTSTDHIYYALHKS